MIRTNVGQYSYAIQEGQGIPASAPRFASRADGGSLSTSQKTDTHRYSDGAAFGASLTYTSEISGGGEPSLEALPGAVAFWMAAVLGTDQTTDMSSGSTDSTRHEIRDGLDSPWLTMWKDIGSGATRQITRYEDAFVSQVVFAASSDSPVATLTPTIVALNPGIASGAVPAAAQDYRNKRSLLFTDFSGTLNVKYEDETGAVAYLAGSIRQIQVTINRGDTARRTDGVRASTRIAGAGEISVQLSVDFGEAEMRLWNMLRYGMATPYEGATPTVQILEASLAATASTGSTIKAGEQADTLSIEMPLLRLTTSDEPQINGEAGAAEIGLAGIASTGAFDDYGMGVGTRGEGKINVEVSTRYEDDTSFVEPLAPTP